jgi:hypothetical protein
MSMPKPTFFFSHARFDREVPVSAGLMDTFFEDLQDRLHQFINERDGKPQEDDKPEELGTIDRSVQQGADWDDNLGGKLATDNAFVAVFTPKYLQRPNCGKEVYGFLLRVKDLNIDTDGALTGIKNIVPIRWLPRVAYPGMAIGSCRASSAC